MNRIPFDLLLITSQSQSIEEINRIADGFSSCFLLTPHLLFDTEKQRLSPRIAVCKTFADFLSDEELDHVNNEVIATFSPYEYNSGGYRCLFMRRMIAIKNLLIQQKIMNQYHFSEVVCGFDLGIDFSVWERFASAKPLLSQNTSLQNPSGLIQRVYIGFRHLKNKLSLFFQKTEIEFCVKDQSCFIFPSGMKRIILCDGIQKQKQIFKGMDNYRLNMQKDAVRKKFIEGRIQSFGKKNQKCTFFFCSTVHNYHPDSDIVFCDGFLPANYGRCYYNYIKCKYFAVNLFSTVPWIELLKLKPVALPQIISIPLFPVQQKRTFSKKPRILVALNHAGNWNALINRSDTEKLVEASVAVAEHHQGLEFTIRCHPTMIHPEHEGINSLKRIKEYLVEKKYANLHFSEKTLDEDLENSDLIITEYSNVLIIGYSLGIPGLIVNLTGRRSFMEEFEKIGFSNVNSFENFESFFSDFEKNYANLIANNNTAVQKFNALQQTLKQKYDLFSNHQHPG